MRTLGRFNSVWMFEAANVGGVVAAITDLLQAKGAAESRITVETTDGANSCVNEELREEKKGSLKSVTEAAWSTDDHL